MLTFYAKAPARLSVVVIEHNGDRAWSRVPEEATAFGHRNWPYNFLITTIWTDAADTEDNIRWTREFWNAMRPFLAEAAYVNYLGETAEEDVRIAYGRKYQRLALSKRNTTLTISFT